MKQKNLFGALEEPPAGIKKPRQARQREILGYRLATKEKDRCKFCKHLIPRKYNDKTYYKCRFFGVSSSEATDIKLKNVCNLFVFNPYNYYFRFNKLYKVKKHIDKQITKTKIEEWKKGK